MSWAPLLLSFQVAAAATVLTAIFGVGLGALLATRRFPGRNLIDVLVTTPLVLPPTVLGYYVLVLLGRRSPIGAAWESVTGSTIVFTKTGAIVAATLGALPFVVKAARAALETVDPMLVRAAWTLGASPLRAFFTVQLPLAMRGIVAGLVLGFAKSLGEFGITLMVAGNIPGETQTAALAVYDAIQANRESTAAALIATTTALAIATLFAVQRLTGRSAGQ